MKILDQRKKWDLRIGGWEDLFVRQNEEFKVY